MSSFLVKVQGGTIEFVDIVSMVYLHALEFEIFPKNQRSGRLYDCILLGIFFVIKLIEYLNRIFIDLYVFNVVKFFSPRNYY